MALIRNLILIAFSNIILCQVEGIRAIVSYLISGSVSNVNHNVNHNKFENHKNSTLKHFLPSGVWTVRCMSDFYMSVGVTLII